MDGSQKQVLNLKRHCTEEWHCNISKGTESTNEIAEVSKLEVRCTHDRTMSCIFIHEDIELSGYILVENICSLFQYML